VVTKIQRELRFMQCIWLTCIRMALSCWLTSSCAVLKTRQHSSTLPKHVRQVFGWKLAGEMCRGQEKKTRSMGGNKNDRFAVSLLIRFTF
jgi:hypothetical protein